MTDLRKDEAKKLSSKKTEEDKLKQQQKRISAQEKQIKTHLTQIQQKQADREQMSNSHEQNTADAGSAEVKLITKKLFVSNSAQFFHFNHSNVGHEEDFENFCRKSDKTDAT